jgi:hypothetical protein
MNQVGLIARRHHDKIRQTPEIGNIIGAVVSLTIGTDETRAI